MKINKLICALFSFAIMLSILAVPIKAEDKVKVILNGTELTFDVPPQIINDRTMVPMRKIFEALDAKVAWDDNTKTVTATKDDITIVMQIDNEVIFVGEKEIRLDVPPQIVDSRTLVPIRAVAEGLNADVKWYDETRTVLITKEERPVRIPDASEPEQKAIAPVDGFNTTTSNKFPIKIQTPKDWVYIEPTAELTDEIAAVLKRANFDSGVIEYYKDTNIIVFIDKANATDTFSPNFNVTQTSTSDKQSDLPDAIAAAKTMIESSFSTLYENFKWVILPKGKTIGNNYYIIMASSYTAMKQNVTGYQAITAYNGQLYAFSYTITPEMHSDDLFAVFEKVLSSVEFVK